MPKIAFPPLPKATRTPPAFEIVGVGHDCSPGHDKVWGYLRAGDQYCGFWGRRQGPWTFKVEGGYGDRIFLDRKLDGKIAGGYDDATRSLGRDPEFIRAVQTQFSQSAFFGRFHEKPKAS